MIVACVPQKLKIIKRQTRLASWVASYSSNSVQVYNKFNLKVTAAKKLLTFFILTEDFKWIVFKFISKWFIAEVVLIWFISGIIKSF